MVYKQSGDKTSRKFNGSTMTGSHLYAEGIWMVTPSKFGRKIKGNVGQQLGDHYSVVQFG